ncbi:MAG: M20/M25/M40 family metallo-hydrolase [Pseudomonadota bacterium]
MPEAPPSLTAPTVDAGRLRRLLRRLVDIYSPSGKEEEILEFCQGYLKRRGLKVERQEVDEYRYNLLVLPESGEARLALVGHLDTVVAYDLENLGVEDEGDRVIGLGAADMKAGCAAMIEAMVSLHERQAGLPLALCLVVGEEEDGDGAQALAGEHRFPWAIIGEPTELQPCTAHYGYVEAQLITRGRRRHASLANNHQNPIQAMLDILLRVSRHMASRPEMAYNIRDLRSAPEGFVVPELCEAWLDVHLPPTSPLGELTRELEEVVAGARRDTPGLEAELKLFGLFAGYQLSDKEPLLKELARICEIHGLTLAPSAFRSHSDANLLWAAGIKPLLLGPGSLEQAHAPNEWVDFAQVRQAAALYQELALAALA